LIDYALGAELSVFAVLYKSNLANSETEQLTLCIEHSLFFLQEQNEITPVKVTFYEWYFLIYRVIQEESALLWEMIV